MVKRKRRQRGTGSLVPPTKPGGPWGIRWYEKGQRRFQSFPSRELADRVLAKIRGDIAAERGGLPPDPRGFPPLSELAAEWLERRKHTHPRSHRDEAGRWNRHLADHFGNLRACDVDPGRIRAFAESKLREGLGPGTVRLCIMELSTFYTDLCERPRESGATFHPVKALPRSMRRLWRSRYDPRLTPFLERMEDVRSLYHLIAWPYSVAFAIGAFAGLRTAEILGLDWQQVNLETGRLIVRWQVQRGQLVGLKDEEPRILTIRKTLVPVLKEYRMRTGGRGLLFPAARAGRISGTARKAARFTRPHTLADALKAAAVAAGLPDLCDWEKPWYQSTRHTFASQFVMAGGSLEKLAAILGHSSTEVTKRYAHLRPEHFAAEDADLLAVDLSTEGTVLALSDGQALGSEAPPTKAAKRRKS